MIKAKTLSVLSGASLAALVAVSGTAAHAQQAPGTAVSDASAGEIVVTANKR